MTSAAAFRHRADVVVRDVARARAALDAMQADPTDPVSAWLEVVHALDAARDLAGAVMAVSDIPVYEVLSGSNEPADVSESGTDAPNSQI